MDRSRHFPVRDWRGEIVSTHCRSRSTVDSKHLLMADRPEDLTCRRCLASPVVQELLRKQREQEEALAGERQRRAIAMLIERHREEYEALLEGEDVLDVLGRTR